MVWSGALFRLRRPPSLAKDSGGTDIAMQGDAGRKEGKRSYASQSRISAMAAGAACTNNILRLTVTAP
jgi:hypothetical protein